MKAWTVVFYLGYDWSIRSSILLARDAKQARKYATDKLEEMHPQFTRHIFERVEVIEVFA